jgi:AraC-like DNA-binding protein
MPLDRSELVEMHPWRPISPGHVRVSAFRPLTSLLATRGLDAGAVLSRAGVDRALLADADNVISLRDAGSLLRVASEASASRQLGLLLAHSAVEDMLGVLWRAAACAATLGDALRTISEMFDLHNGAGVAELVVETGLARWEIALLDTDVPCLDQFLDGAALVSVRLLRALRQRTEYPLEVLLPRERPDDIGQYRRLFGVPVRFESDRMAIVFPREWLDTPLPGADASRHAALMASLRRCRKAAAVPFVEQVRRSIRRQLCGGRASIAMTAQQLGMHRRSVDRHLKAGGTDFQTVKDEVRFACARHLLRDTRLPVRAIASALRFSDVSAFDHAFRRWTAMTPRAWRAQHATAAPADGAMLVPEGRLAHHAGE